MTRQEHMKWCKQRAIQYADAGDLKNAVASMLSDLTKHDETRKEYGGQLGLLLADDGQRMVKRGDRQGVLRWINGFAE